MTDTPQSSPCPKMSCDACPFRRLADKSPFSFLGKLWVWHTSFCPGWKRYVKARHEHGEAPPTLGSNRNYWSD